MSRKTEQRGAIRRVFEDAERPLTPQEVLSEAQKEITGLGIATVYRNVKTLTESGFLHPVELPNQPVRYELANMDHHHHFHCEACGRVFDIPGCPNGLERGIPNDFNVKRHEVLLFGECSSCARAS